MINLVEFAAESDEQSQSPCKFGNIVEGHACYCHADHWKDGPRKCPVWRHFGTDATKWLRREWPAERVPVFVSAASTRYEMRRLMPDDDIGGCPEFEPAVPASTASGSSNAARSDEPTSSLLSPSGENT